VALSKQTINKVRFGIFITFKIGDDTKLQRYQIVGVDEADISKENLIHFSSARILLDKKVGDKTVLKLAKANRVLKSWKLPIENCKNMRIRMHQVL
jgi:transcription elongation factor GreB